MRAAARLAKNLNKVGQLPLVNSVKSSLILLISDLTSATRRRIERGFLSRQQSVQHAFSVGKQQAASISAGQCMCAMQAAAAISAPCARLHPNASAAPEVRPSNCP